MKLRRFALPLLALLSLLSLGGCPHPERPPRADAIGLRFNVGGVPTPIVTTETPAFRTEPVFESIPGKSGSHAPALTAFADGELLAAWYSYSGPGELDGAAIYTARCAAGGGWTPPELLIARRESVGNPVLYSECNTVWLFHAVVSGSGWSTAHIEVQQSSDRGQTWSAARVVDGRLGSNVRFPPVRVADDTLLLPAYDDLLPRSLFYSPADAESWSLRSVLATEAGHANIQPSVVALADGRLLAIMRNAGHGWLWVAASDDGGRSWTTPADSGFPNPASPAVLLRLTNGHLVLVYNDSNTDRHPLSITVSADDGATWYPARILIDAEGAYAYPAVIQAPDGLIHIVYSHDRQRIQHISLNEAWIATDSR